MVAALTDLKFGVYDSYPKMMSDRASSDLTHYRPAMPFGNRKKNILEDLFSSVFSKFEKYDPPGNLLFNNLGIFKSLKLRNLVGKIFRISLKLNFTPNTFGCYGLFFLFSHQLFDFYWI